MVFPEPPNSSQGLAASHLRMNGWWWLNWWPDDKEHIYVSIAQAAKEPFGSKYHENPRISRSDQEVVVLKNNHFFLTNAQEEVQWPMCTRIFCPFVGLGGHRPPIPWPGSPRHSGRHPGKGCHLATLIFPIPKRMSATQMHKAHPWTIMAKIEHYSVLYRF